MGKLKRTTNKTDIALFGLADCHGTQSFLIKQMVL